MGVPISSFTFENVDYEIKDAVARDAMASLNGFEYAICSTTENTPSGVSFTDSDTGFTVTGTLAASSSTKNVIYLVPANGGEAKNVYEEYITVELTKTVENAETTVYQWEKIGSTAIDLNGYLTTDDAAAFAPKAAPVFTGSISMGRKTNSEIGTNSVAAGENVSAIGYDSHAEGRSTTAIGPESHAEGSGTTTQGIGSHAEGMGSTANANYSHAEGRETVADGEYSHAEGLGTIARGRYEHVSGKYNIPDSAPAWEANTRYNIGDIVSYRELGAVVDKIYRCNTANSDSSFDDEKWSMYSPYLFMIGNGTDNANRSNALTVDIDGNAVFAGTVTVGAPPVNDMDVATKKYVDDNAGSGSSVDTSTLAPKADPAFTGSISMGRDANSTAGANSIATGVNVVAEGNQSHAEGMMTKAIGENSHAEGTWTNASGGNSHAEGLYTTALGKSEHVSGQFNVLDTATAWVADTSYNVGDVVSRVENGVTKIYRCKTANSNASWSSSNWEEYGQYLFVVGNGTDGNNRSNAFSVDWDGNTKASGKMSIGKYDVILDKTTIPAWVDGNGYAVGDYVTASIPAPGGPGIFRCVQAIAAGSDASHAQPPYAGNYWATGEAVIFTVGNGTDDQHRSNAFTVNKYGNAVFAGKATVGRAPVDDMDVATKKYVDDNTGSNIDTSTFATKAYPQFTGSISMGRNTADMTIPLGANSVALGNNVIASGANSVALGDNVVASGDGEIALGKYNDTGSAPAWEANHQYKLEEVVSRVEDGKTVFYKCIYPNSDSEFDSNKWSRQGYSLYIFSIGDGISNSHKNVFSINYQRGVSEGYKNVASGAYSHAEGQQTVASGLYSHAEGANTIAEYPVSHAEGSNTEAHGQMSHAEGSATKTYGYSAHAEGCLTVAGGDHSHSEGEHTESNGTNSHAEGLYTTALGKSEHVSGQFNVLDPATAWVAGTSYNAGDVVSYTKNGVTKIYRCRTDNSDAPGDSYNWEEYGQYLFVVGNGTDDTHRSNAATIDWDGNAVFAGKVTVGVAPVNDMDAVTKQYVDNIAGHMPKDIKNVEVVNIGYSNDVIRGNYGILINGTENKVNGNSNIISGQGLNVRGTYKTVIGKYNVAPESYPEFEIGHEYHAGDIVIAPDADGGSTVYRCKDTYTYVDEYDDGIYYGILDGSSKWEVYDDGHIFTIGNGTDDQHRSNAFSVDLDGNTKTSGKMVVGVNSSYYYVSDNSMFAVTNGSDDYHTQKIIFSVNKNNAIAAGYNANASGENSFAESQGTTSGSMSHAEGWAGAYGSMSHAEGRGDAYGSMSHAEGYGTAIGYAEHVLGQYNVLDTAPAWVAGTSYNVGDVVSIGRGSNMKIYRCTIANNDSDFDSSKSSYKWEEYGQYLFVIGNGTAGQYGPTRSNAFTVDWSGNATAQTSITIGNTTINEAQLQALLALLNTQNANGQSF